MGLGQSWTDPFSNHTNITNVGVSHQLDDLVGVGTTPLELLLPLMHESSHHWCFLSTVGNTISAINSRLRQQAVERIETAASSDVPLIQGYVASKVATEMLRPISEGIALTMEFDSVSQDSNFISRPFLGVGRAFAPGYALDPAMAAMPTNAALTSARMSPRGVDRRLNVYADRLDAEGNGYLLGYLSARSMMRSLWCASSRLIKEADLCASYLRTYIYGDWELVDLLLERDVEEIRFANAIREYISNRLWDVTHVTEAQIELFETLAAEERPLADPQWAVALRYDADKAARGQRRLEALAEKLESLRLPDHPELAELYAGLILVDREISKARPRVYLGGDDVTIQVEHGECTVRLEGRTLLASVPTDAEDGVATGSIDVYYDSQALDARRYVHICSEQQGTIAFVIAGPDLSGAAVHDFSPLYSAHTVRELSAVYDSLVAQAVASGHAGVAVAHFARGLPDVCQSLYLDVATRFIDVRSRAQVVETLSRGACARSFATTRTLPRRRR
ncbi:hypothetical protein [Aeromicrobium duanguangcaii]|uniref:Uncharacterized protein n=1 Tax=Aeromicrobium duanguangcaii TaxID=2968086 RepID=A0ABY5KBE7_9ACTN|nr:hypothetical protein [Aeromicrobium duanguangcaii]MCD9152788.1 hypothetical protein [Aeromicrobium duanguangcaii]UUI67230.1 hypothetical protein NP095_08395 [Aeromicrobium duanguangcaii]